MSKIQPIAPEGVKLNSVGRMENPEAWDEEAAVVLAGMEGLQLTADHWDIIRLMREYYATFRISPIMKLLKKAIDERFDPAMADEVFLQRLFPGGVLVQGTKIAGLPVPHLDAELDRNQPSKRPRMQAMSEGSGSLEDVLNQQFEFEGHTIHLSHSGNVIEHHLWSERLAEHMAKRENISMGADHWSVIYFLREFYFEYGITPMVHLLRKHLTSKTTDRTITMEYLYDLFPGGPSRQGSRIAGLPEPQGCIDD